MVTMELSEAGLTLIKVSEGLRTKVYLDGGGNPTIGYGHMLTPGESFPDGIDDAQATAFLREDTAFAVHAVNTLVVAKVKLTQNQFDALVDFVYNLGARTLLNSTLYKDLLAGKFSAAADQFLLWDHAGGKVEAGLVKRRAAERTMFLATA
jgi:lysozyme